MFPSITLHACLLTALLIPSLPALAAGQGDWRFTPKPTCDPTQTSCAPGIAPPPCLGTQCLGTLEEQAKYEKENDCKFPASACGDFDTKTQCCGKDPRTGKPRVVDKVMDQKGVISPGLDSFTWTNYKWACPNMKQNDAPPNALWQQCEKGKKHSPEDDYEITEARKNQNGSARDYCIDGCSTPPSVVATLYATKIFLALDRSNPSGYKTATGGTPASFQPACAAHDVCYQTCNGVDQVACDAKLEKDSKAACQSIPAGHKTQTGFLMVGPVLVPQFENTRTECEKAAQAMHTGLKKFGKTAFNLRRQQYCQCC